MDVDKVGDGARIFVAKSAIVAFSHPSHSIFLFVFIIGEVVSREEDHRCANACEDVGVGEFEFPRRILIVAVRKHDAFLRAESRKARERAEVAVIKGIHDHLRLAGEVEVAGFNPPSRVGRTAPVIHLADRSDEKFRINHGIVAVQVIGIQIVKRIGVRVSATLVEVLLDVVNESLVSSCLVLSRQTEILLCDMLGGIEPHAVIVHGVSQPIDPAGHEVPRIFTHIAGLVEVGVFFRIAGMPNERRGVGGVVWSIIPLEATVELQNDIHEADEFLMERPAGAIVR